MGVAFDTIDRNKLYVEIVNRILERIRNGSLRPGDRLMPERVLAEQLGVSRSSVREALRVLEHARIVRGKTGAGTYVTEAAVSREASIRLRAAMEMDENPLEILTVRTALETWASATAADLWEDPDQLKPLEVALHRQETLIEQGKDPLEADLSFHLALASLTDNSLLLRLMEQLVALMRQNLWQELKQLIILDAANAWKYLREHHAVLEAIRQRAPSEAAQAMRTHLASIEADILDSVRVDLEQGRNEQRGQSEWARLGMSRS
jgi:GntR family transcriptional repressor for pyruvate dehydrogenase complex